MDVGISGAGSSVALCARAAAGMLAAAEAAFPLEACGLLFGDGASIREATVAANVSAEPWHRFEIEPAHLFDAHRRDRAGPLKLLGCWHSHPNGRGEPSGLDREGVADMGWLWLIVAAGEISGWRPAGDGFRPVALERGDS